MAWFLFQSTLGLLSGAACICVVLALELAWPRETLMSMRDRLRACLFAALFVPIGALSGLALMWLYGFQPLLRGFGIADALIAFLVYDFFYYWYHRAQHTIPFLWRIHSVHHSAEALGAGAGYHHFLEAPFKGLLVGIPAHLFFGPGMGQLAIWLTTIHGYYVHSSTTLHFGPFRMVFPDNRVHRIHHSRDPGHFNRNFGFPTMIWDHLFRTALMPAANEWPSVGLDECGEPKSVMEWLRLPARPASITSAAGQ